MITDNQMCQFVSANLQRLMKVRDMSRYKLAQLTGENQVTLASVYFGEHVVRSSILARIAEALSMTPLERTGEREEVLMDDLKADPRKVKKTSRKLATVA